VDETTVKELPGGARESDPVRVVPLGGLGEIGLNLMVIECGTHAIIIDAGVMFPEERDLGIGLILPELAYLEQSRLTLDGIVLTHGHEDHIGALPDLLRRFPAPVYGTEVTLAFARRGLAEDGLAGADLREIVPGRTIELGPFTVEPIRVTHSTPDSVALAIRTPGGLIVHSGDFKIDPSPVDGQLFDTERFAQLGEEGVTLLLSDSTNVEREGRAGSESSIKPILTDLIKRTKGRFLLTSFSSHLHRIRQFAEVAHEAGRYVVPLGRRMAESVRLGAETGHLHLPPGTFIDRTEADFLEPRRLAFLASGSQGEPLSAMAKLATDTHPQVHLDEGDVVVLSSRSIPGNERPINGVINNLYKRGAEVYYDTVAPVHVSGHANREELTELIRLVKPRHFVPVHGEYRHLTRHRRLAIEAGMPEANCFLMEDGETLVLEGGVARRGRNVTAGRVVADGDEIAADSLLRERRALARDGTLMAVVAVSARRGRLVAGPDLIARGLVSENGASPHMKRARTELAERLRALKGDAWAEPERLKEEMVRVLRRYFIDETGKRPIVVPYVVEV
jgi:ribonuclease J